ncbi:B3/4 domain-containing protein [Sphingomonas montana]|uniref:B3/B4 domain-containing protein n=1 Tax=Sphingomonas montana TaxID=1843236 RepID=UPI00096F96C4|nr:phenylalanine--tRNA ligase beta subunit-related protein [Sphingomonas montana]
MQTTPIIDPAVMRLASDFRALHLLVSTQDPTPVGDASAALAAACKYVRDGGPSWAETHLAAWAETYVGFGARPSRTPCSAQALRKRVLKDGTLPAINPVVDLYNAISLRYAVPVGGENLSAYVGLPRLTIADGTEVFDTMSNGEPAVEHPLPGEVVWRDDVGVTCRRWNWRQGTRTRLNGGERSMWFVLEALAGIPDDAQKEAGDALANGLISILPSASVTMIATA